MCTHAHNEQKYLKYPSKKSCKNGNWQKQQYWHLHFRGRDLVPIIIDLLYEGTQKTTMEIEKEMFTKINNKVNKLKLISHFMRILLSVLFI